MTRRSSHVLTENEARFADAIPTAMQLVSAVHDYEILRVHELIERADLPAVVVALAAMVPEDKTRRELLAWTEPPPPEPRGPRELQPCGTHAAFVRHRGRGEIVDDACLEAERAYQRERKRAARNTDVRAYRRTA